MKHICIGLLYAFAAGGLIGAAAGGGGASGPVINHRLLAQQQPVSPRVFDSHPGWVELQDGKGGFAAWHSFVPGAERIVGRTLGDRSDLPWVDLAGGGGVFTPPEIAASGDGSLAVAWSAWNDGRWTVRGRRMENGKWSEVATLSPPDRDALHGVPAALGRGEFGLAWTEWRGGRFEIVFGPWSARGAGEPVRISDPATDAFRPQLVPEPGGGLHIVWDAYARNTHQIFSRQVRPALGPIERVSNSADRCLKPAAFRGADGALYAAWVRATDVTAAATIVDQTHALQVARRDAAGWRPVVNRDGTEEAAWLTSGLLAQVEPKSVPTGGYMGRRRDPMFVREGSAVWLVWERKASHAGSTHLIAGELLGRKIEGAGIGPTVVLTKGLVDYRVAHHAEVRNGRFTVMGSTLPRDGQRAYSLVTVVLGNAQPATTEPFPGWKRAELPLPEAGPRRHELSDRGREYRLFWMDSHVHSALSADAEGEPDEILFYARDRGRLDAVVMQENDFYNCPLTDWEYQLGGFFARALSREGSFVALPGYEWTQRVPSDPAQPVDQPRFWTGSVPNHRTVIYPRAGGPLVRYVDVGNDIRRLYDTVAAHGGVMHTQHPEFEFTGAAGEVAIEVTAGWGIYFLNPGRIHATLNRGFRAGFVGTSDSHRRNPGLGGGLTGIYATALTPDAILEAYRARRVFATSGSRIAVEARANGVLMGQEARTGGGAKLTVAVIGSRPIRRATLLRDGEPLKVFEARGDSASAQFEYEVRESAAGTHWFYWRIEQEGVSQHYGGNVSAAFGNLAWSTPNWVTFKP